jgi:hypothetical protein
MELERGGGLDPGGGAARVALTISRLAYSTLFFWLYGKKKKKKKKRKWEGEW